MICKQAGNQSRLPDLTVDVVNKFAAELASGPSSVILKAQLPCNLAESSLDVCKVLEYLD